MADTRWSFSKRAFENPGEVQVLAGGQTTLNGKDAPISAEKLTIEHNASDNSISVHASVFDSPYFQKYIDKIGGPKAAEKIYAEKHLDQESTIDDELDEALSEIEPNDDWEPLTIISPKFDTDTDIEVWSDRESNAPMVSKFRHLAQTQTTPLSDFPMDAILGTRSPEVEARTAHRQALLDQVSNPRLAQHVITRECINNECSKPVPSQAKFCPNCGEAQLAKFCMECSHQFQPSEKFCPGCGTKR